jgi:hypothetical protein
VNAGSFSGGAQGLEGTQPSAVRPTSARVRRPRTPSQMPRSCAGCGPGFTPERR